MWQTISNISSLITCFLFITFFVGRIWRIRVGKCTQSEDIEFIKCKPNDDYALEEYDDESGNIIYVDEKGEQFSIASKSGIRKMNIYGVNNRLGEDGLIPWSKKELKCDYKFKDFFKPVYISCNLGELYPLTFFEFQRLDYSVVTFELFQSKKNGMPIKRNCKCRLTLRTILYYLCE